MIDQYSFLETDFDVFQIPGLEPRMSAIQNQIQPKFQQLGETFADVLTLQTGVPMFVHIARHARRTVHPPDKTWMAWSANRRGYKPYPHFQFGINENSLFIWFAIFSECKTKKQFATELMNQLDDLWPKLPNHFLFSEDHTKSDVIPLTDLTVEQVLEKLKRLEQVKKAEFLTGIQIPREQAIQLSWSQLQEQTQRTFEKVQSLYDITQS